MNRPDKLPCNTVSLSGKPASAWRQPDLLASPAGRWFFATAMCFTIFLDYFQNTIVGISSQFIMGNIGAGPEEYAWSTTAYAIVTVLVISKLSWLVQHLGFRRYLTLSVLLFGLGAFLAGSSNSPMELVMARAIQGLGGGALFTGTRIAFEEFVRTDDRIKLLNFYFIGCMLGIALGPLTAGYLVMQSSDWRWVFYLLVPLSLMTAVLVYLAVPERDTGLPPSRFHYGGIITLALGIGLLQIFSQQVHFEVLHDYPLLRLLLIAALAALAFFVWHQFTHEAPLLKLKAISRRSFLIGIGIYFMFYFGSYAFNYVYPMFMGSLGFNPEAIGETLMINGTISMVCLLFVNFTLLKPGRNLHALMVIGYGIGFVVCIAFSLMSSSAGLQNILPPLILQAVMVSLVVAPIPVMTFSELAPQDFASGYQVKNIVRQMGNAIGIASMAIFLEYRDAFHQQALMANVDNANPAVTQGLSAMTHDFMQQGYGQADSYALAMSYLDSQFNRQVSLFSYSEAFRLLAICFLGFAVIISACYWFQQKGKRE